MDFITNYFDFQIPLNRAFFYLILLFFVFSVAGWLMEVVLKYIQFHRFINRGFLIGPYCPIYGSGAVIVTVVVRLIAGEEPGYAEAFLISFVFCGILEYFSSWYMEKLFHARWWDYSEKPMNLEGRIWIGNLILFGIGGVFIVKLIAPFLFRQFDRLSEQMLMILGTVIMVVMTADYIFSHIITFMVRKVGEASKGDDTEAIGREIRQFLAQHSFPYRRLLNAFPNMQARTTRIQKRLHEERARVRSRVKEEKRRLYDLSQNLKPENIIPENLKPENIIPEKLKPDNLKLENIIPEKLKPENFKAGNFIPEGLKRERFKNGDSPDIQEDVPEDTQEKIQADSTDVARTDAQEGQKENEKND